MGSLLIIRHNSVLSIWLGLFVVPFLTAFYAF